MTEIKEEHVISDRKENYQVGEPMGSYKGQSPPVKITFTNLEFEVDVVLSKEEAKAKGVRTVKQQIVKGASGYALPGETLYIMGSSGAGKTSLLNILSDRISNKNGQVIKGKVMVNDKLALTQEHFGKFGAYVMQDDILYDSFTPREALTFAARLKLQGTEAEQDARVEDLLQELGLTNVANTLIGSVLRKTISGGERKRTSIGVELITDPSLILLDEPTSGLDSFKALQIVRLLDRQAKKGKTVITTIHQPSSEAFQIFDRLILMMDGYIVYQGKAKDSTSYFATMGFNCPSRSNPADFFMKVLTVNYPKEEDDEKKIQNIYQHYTKSQVPQIEEKEKSVFLPEINLENQQRGAGTCKQFQLLIWRNRQGLKRNPGHGRVKMGQSVFMGLICLALFHDQYGYSQIASLIGGLFFIAINQTMMNLMGTILTFQNERPVFLREQANKMYTVGAYYIAKIIIETPILAIAPMIFCIIVYFKIGLTIAASQFFYFYLIVFLIGQSAASFGYFVSSIFEKEDMAVALAPIIMMPLMLFGGQFANSGNIQAWISWFQYISPIRYGFEALNRNEFDSRQYNSTAVFLNSTTKKQLIIPDVLANWKDYNIYLNNPTLQPIQTATVNPMSYLGQDVGLWKCLVILAALAIGLRFLSFIFLKLLVSKFQ